MKPLRSLLLMLAAVSVGLLSSRLLVAQQGADAPAKSAPAVTGPQGKVETIKVHGKSLEGNLEGDSADREVFVYLPPSYANNGTRRYPVVYLLHGYGLTGSRWMTFANIAAASDKGIAAGITKEMIVVSPDAYSLYNGSMYSNSATTGDWEGYISDDLVSYVDSHYRTIADRVSRGLGGHSMGGYGTFRIGMKHPEVFGALYPMSSCCLNANLNPNPQQMAAYEVLNSPEEAKAKAQAKGKDKGKGGGFALTTLAQAAAWSPNPKNPPFYFDLPVKDGQIRPDVVARWAANAPLAMVTQYIPQLKMYRAIAMDVGLQDSLLRTNQQMDSILTEQGVPHTFETYEGDHNNRVPLRIEEKVLPFFSNNLTFK